MACSDIGLKGYECTLTLDGATVGKAQNVDPSFTVAELPATTRDSGGYAEVDGGELTMTFSVEALWVPGNEAIQRIEQAMRAREKITYKMQDGAGYGWSGCCICLAFNPGPRPLDANVMLTAEFKNSGYPTKICGDGSGGSTACGSTYGDWGSGTGN